MQLLLCPNKLINMTTQTDLLTVLNAVDFPRLYWEMCDRFPLHPSELKQGTKADFLAAFRDVGITPRYESQTFTFEEEEIAGILWSAVFIKQRYGLELRLEGSGGNESLGSNLAVLAYEAKKLADPNYKRDMFNGPPPYPRPDHRGNPIVLRGILDEFVRLIRLIKDELRKQSGK